MSYPNDCRVWSPQEESDLRRLYPHATPAQLREALPGRSFEACACHARKTHLHRLAGQWGAEERDIIRLLYPKHGAKFTAQFLNPCRHRRITEQAHRLGVQRIRAERPPRAKRAKRTRPAKSPAAAPALRPQLAPAAAQLRRTPRGKGTPVLDQRVLAKQQEKKAASEKVPITAEQAKKLTYGREEWKAYARGGAWGWHLYHNPPPANG